MNTSNPVIDELARYCREAYIHERRQLQLRTGDEERPYSNPGPKWDGGMDSRGAVHKPVWPKIAQFMLKHRLNPSVCMMIRFSMAGHGTHAKHPPLPHQIALDKYLPVYTGQSISAEVTEEDVRVAKISESQSCRNQFVYWMHYMSLSQADAARVVLTDDSLPVSPLTRYCLACSMQLTALAERYEAAAVAQYLLAPDAYDAVWKEALPTVFTTKARALCMQIAGSK